MPELLARLAAAALAVTFSWAAVAKVVRFAPWRDALGRYNLPPLAGTVALGGVPLAEVAVVGLLLTGATKAGAALALALLALFSLALFAAHVNGGDRLPCGCFGRATERDYRVMLLRNSMLALCAGVVLAGPTGLRLTEGWRPPEPSEAVPAALVALGVALVFIVAWGVEQASRRGRR